MFKIIRKQTRPNTNVPFWQGGNEPTVTDEFRNYFYEHYVLTGKFISSTPTVSSDGLELLTTSIWNSEAEHDAVKDDQVVQEGLTAKAKAAMEANGVTQEIVSRETF